MEENLQTSQPNGRRRTAKTSKLTLEQTLEILTQSFRMAEDVGIQIDVSADNGQTVITLTGIVLENGALVPVS